MKYKLLLALVLVVAAGLRLFQLGSNPPSLDWDEVSIGYNAYSLLQTGSDEYGNSWPFSIRSFNDYKPPLYTYVTMPFVAILGLTEVAVRLPSALAGILAVYLTYLLVQEIFRKHKQSEAVALATAALLAVSPWHLQFSRAAFESNLALTGYLATVYLFIRWLREAGRWQLTWLLAAAVSGAATLYAYHSARLVLPLMLMGIVVMNYKRLLGRWRSLGLAILVGALLISPFVYITFFRSSSLARFNTVSFLGSGEFSEERERFARNAQYYSYGGVNKLFHHRYLVNAAVISRNYFDHFNPDFLFLESDTNPRHHAYGMGLLYLIELPLLVYGGYRLVGEKKVEHKWLIAWWFIVAPVASALTDSTPHAIRSLLLLPGFQVVTGFGLVKLFWESSRWQWLIRGSVIGLFSLNVFYYINLYYVVTPYHFAKDWQYGYKELVARLQPLESEYDQIIVTNKYDQPHIYFAFYQPISPHEYQPISEMAHQMIGPYRFKEIDWEDFDQPNILMVVEPKRLANGANVLDTIAFPNGEVAFYLVETN